MYLNATTDKLEIVLGGTVATSQLQWNVSYQDITSTGMTLPQSAGAGLTNNATAVDIVAAPAASTTRQVTHINVFNADTATATVTIQKDVSGTNYVLISYSVVSGDTLMWSREDGWRLAKAGGGGTISIGTINSQTKSADGAVISGSSLVMQTAEATFPGLVSTGTQTFAGAKTFSSAPTFTGFTAGSVLFAGTSGLLSQDNSNLFWDDANNRLGIGTNAPSTAIQIISDLAQITFTQYNSIATNGGGFIVSRARGTFASPSAVQSGDVLAGFFINGYTSAGAFGSNVGALRFLATENYTSTAQGIAFQVLTTPNGSITRDTRLQVYGSGNVVIQNGGTFTDAGFRLDVNGTTRLQDNVTITDAKNIILATTTGTKIGTATSQKLGFWNAAPIVQPTTAVAAATRVGGGGTTVTDTDTFDGYTIAQVVKALRNTGILA